MNINFRETSFLLGVPRYDQLPQDDMPEIAVAGRSNAGKSSLINTLCEQYKLARKSGAPGKTREINAFGLPENKEIKARLMDLPGYGYAKAGKKLQELWQNELSRYLLERPRLGAIIIVMDARHPFTDADLLLVRAAAHRNIKQIFVFSKMDKLNQSERGVVVKIAEKAVYDTPASQKCYFSSLKKTGREELRAIINETLDAID